MATRVVDQIRDQGDFTGSLADGYFIQYVLSSNKFQLSPLTYPVNSVFGRTGNIIPVTGDYSFGQISGIVGLTQGGTGQNTANASLNALLPNQSGNSGKYLSSDGTNTSWVALSVSPGGANTQIQFNDSGAFAGSNQFVFDKLTGKLSLSPTVRTSGSPSIFVITGSADTTLAAGVEATDINFALNRTVQFATGAIATQRAIRIQAPTYSFVGASTITNVATVSISGAPIAGTNATLTNSVSLVVDSGSVFIGSSPWANPSSWNPLLVVKSGNGAAIYAYGYILIQSGFITPLWFNSTNQISRFGWIDDNSINFIAGATTGQFIIQAATSQSAVILQIKGKSSTSVIREQLDIDTAWATNTDASRKARALFRVWDTLAREAIRLEADGTQALLGFFGSNAVAKPNITGSRAGNAALASLLTNLANLGLITDSTTA